MKPDPSVDSIIWGRKYSLKDRTPQIAVGLFIVFLIMALLFGVIIRDENHSPPSNDVGAEITP